LEKRSDLLLSTLRKYVEAMGGELAVRTGEGTVIVLDSLSFLAKPSAPRRARTSSVVHKPADRPVSKSKVKVKHTGTSVA